MTDHFKIYVKLLDGTHGYLKTFTAHSLQLSDNIWTAGVFAHPTVNKFANKAVSSDKVISFTVTDYKP